MNFTSYLMAGLAAVSLALAGWTSYQGVKIEAKQKTIEARDATIASLTASIVQAKRVNVENVQTIARMQDDLRAQGAISAKYQTLARANAAKLNAILKGISDAPASDDGPVAAVLGRELERLRTDFAAANGADADPSGTPPGS